VGVQELEPVPVPDGETVPVGVDERVVVVELVPESEPVFDELAPAVKDAVGVREWERERLVVELGVIDDVPESELVGELVDVSLGVGGGVEVGVPLREPSSDFVVVGVAVSDSDRLDVVLRDRVDELVNEAVPDCEGVSAAVIVEDALKVDDGVGLSDGVCVGVSVGVEGGDDEGVPVAVCDGLCDGDSVGSGVCDAESVGDAVALPVSERLLVAVIVRVGDAVGVERTSVGDGETVCEGVGGEQERRSAEPPRPDTAPTPAPTYVTLPEKVTGNVALTKLEPPAPPPKVVLVMLK
jgi:hypothetical protein